MFFVHAVILFWYFVLSALKLICIIVAANNYTDTIALWMGGSFFWLSTLTYVLQVLAFTMVFVLLLPFLRCQRTRKQKLQEFIMGGIMDADQL